MGPVETVHPEEAETSLSPHQHTSYSGVVESVLTYCISTWSPSCSMSDKKDLQRNVRGAERVNRVSLPSVQELIRDASHPLHTFSELLPSGKHFQSQES